MSQPLYRDPTARVEDRADDLLTAMTIEEKLAQLGCLWSTSLLRDGVFDPELAAGLMPYGIGQVTRIGAATGLHPRESAALMNAIQRVAIERTRLGIPIVVHEESVGGFCHRDATVFPQGLGLAATWDPDLIERVAGVIREQMRAVGARMALAPVMDVARDPRWGRVEETYGEDPILTGTLATAYVRGLQTADLRDGVVATAKHFLAYAHSDGGRNCGPVHLGQRELLDVYAEPFAARIRDAGLAAVMNSYASLDGAPCGSNPAILTDLLRDQLGFDGVVVSDYSTIDMLENCHRVAADRGEAARIALLAGLDMELPEWRYYREPLMAEVEAGRVPVALDPANDASPFPMLMGHEVSGIVDAVGAGVRGVQVGQRVTTLTQHGYAEYALAPAANVIPLPDHIPLDLALGEPIACAANAAQRAGVRLGDTVALVGAGFMGLLALQFLLRLGAARVIVVEPRASARALAGNLGAEPVVDPAKENPVTSVLDATDGVGADVVVEATGGQHGLDLATNLTRTRGRLIIYGYHQGGPRTIEMQLWNLRGLDVVNAHQRSDDDYLTGMRAGLAMLGHGKLDMRQLVTHRYPLEQIGAAFALAEQCPEGFVKAIIVAQ